MNPSCYGDFVFKFHPIYYHLQLGPETAVQTKNINTFWRGREILENCKIGNMKRLTLFPSKMLTGICKYDSKNHFLKMSIK